MKNAESSTRRPRPDERLFLEMLCLWRGLYGHRGPQDRMAVATVEDVVTAAETRIRVRRMRDEQMVRRFSGGWPPSASPR